LASKTARNDSATLGEAAQDRWILGSRTSRLMVAWLLDLSSGHGLAATLRFHLSLCLPSKAVRPPSGSLWLHEIKHDGYRLTVRRDGLRPLLHGIGRHGSSRGTGPERRQLGMLKVSLSAAPLVAVEDYDDTRRLR